MNTNAPTTPLPDLSPIQTLAALALAALAPLDTGARALLQLAAQLKISPHELLEIFARPPVVVSTEAARALRETRADILTCSTDTPSLQNHAEAPGTPTLPEQPEPNQSPSARTIPAPTNPRSISSTPSTPRAAPPDASGHPP